MTIEELTLKWSNDTNPNFTEPTISILDRRSGRWQERKKFWRSLGIEQKQGRHNNLIYRPALPTDSNISQKIRSVARGTSQFDPALAEILIQWFTSENDTILDPFCGGSVRGLIASLKKRYYLGFDVYESQIASNETELHIANQEYLPMWQIGSSLKRMPEIPNETFDFVLTCPPYWNLEIYGNHENDISNFGWDDFSKALEQVIKLCFDKLQDNRFFCLVLGDVRDKKGALMPLLANVILQSIKSGFSLHNHLVTADIIGSGAMVMKERFAKTRKVVTKHQHCLIFLKGDAKIATERIEKLK